MRLKLFKITNKSNNYIKCKKFLTESDYSGQVLMTPIAQNLNTTYNDNKETK